MILYFIVSIRNVIYYLVIKSDIKLPIDQSTTCRSTIFIKFPFHGVKHYMIMACFQILMISRSISNLCGVVRL